MVLSTPCKRFEGPHRSHDGRPIIKRQYAYRVAWEDVYGPLPSDVILHHVCGNSWCVELSHLQPMPQSQHVREHSLVLGDWGQRFKTHCPQGHPYDAANTYTYTTKDGSVERHCKECRRETKRRYRKRLKSKT